MRRRSSLLACGLLAASCAGRGTEQKARPPSIVAPEIGVSYSSPATWRYHPTDQAKINAREDLGGGRSLLVGKRGERWIYDSKAKALEAGSSLAPEDLVAVLRGPDQSFWFVGESGTSYEAREPLGPFVRSSAPFDPLAEVTAAGSTILGVRIDRHLVRSNDGGVSWNVVGPERQSFVDVEMTSDGRALALALPEQLWQSTDGATFTPLARRPEGILSLQRDAATGAVRAVTPLGFLRWQPGASQPFVPDVEKRAPAGDVAEPPLGPDGGAVAEGRAVMAADEYIEAKQVDERTRSWKLHRGKLDAPLTKTNLPDAKGCRALRLAKFGRFITFACFRGSAENTTQTIELYRSDSSGKEFEREPFTPFGSLASFRMAMGDEGTLIVTGVCPSAAAAAGCAPNGVHYRRKARPGASKKARAAEKAAKAVAVAEETKLPKKPPAFELGAAATPSLIDAALALAFSADGKLAYALGRSGKTGQLVLFVSSDGGSTFEPEELDLTGVRDADGDVSDGARAESMVVAEDGAVGIVLARYRTRTLVVTDESGRLLSAANPPRDFALLGAAGTRAIGVDRERGEVWESLDGGATWESAGRLPVDLCGGDGQCEVPVRCAPEGCVIGHELSRIGWGGQAEEELGSPSPGDVSPGDALERRVQTPIECVLSQTPFKPLPGVKELPGAEAAAIGKVAWFAAALDHTRASALMYHGFSGAKPRVETVTLLPPVARGLGYAFTMVGQIEGAAALRYPLPVSGERRITGVELAWNNLFEGRVVQARLRDAGAYLNGDYGHSSARGYIAYPDLVSIGEGGLYVRMHATPKDKQITYFVDGTNVVELPPIPWPGSVVGGRAEMAHVGSEHLGLFLFGQGAAVVRARRQGGAWAFDAGVTGLADPIAFRLVQSTSITYLNGRTALVVGLDDVGGRSSSAQVFGLRPEGDVLEPPVAAPTQKDLPGEPEPCGAAERSSSARLVTPYLPGTRHPLLITDAVDAPRAMVTGLAVLHGTPERPCVAAYDAEPIPNDASPTAQESAIVLLDDLEHAWLFRSAKSGSGEGEVIEYRNMSCRFSPTAEVPPELFRAPGTLAPRKRN